MAAESPSEEEVVNEELAAEEAGAAGESGGEFSGESHWSSLDETISEYTDNAYVESLASFEGSSYGGGGSGGGGWSGGGWSSGNQSFQDPGGGFTDPYATTQAPESEVGQEIAGNTFGSAPRTVTPNIEVHSTAGSDPYLAETPASPDTVSLPDSTSTAGADAVPSTPCEAVTAGCGTNTTPETNALETNLEQGTATAGAGGTVFSGHGSFEAVNGSITVPEGTSLTTYAPHGASITDELGNAIETGSGLENSVFQQTFGPGEAVPNYTLHPPDGLSIAGNPVTVSEPTQLSELLQPNMGACSWAACLSEAGHPLEGAWVGLP